MVGMSKKSKFNPNYPGIKKPHWQQILFRQTRGSVDYIIFPKPRKTFFLNRAKRVPLEIETRKLPQFRCVASENPTTGIGLHPREKSYSQGCQF
jgi:hypothetical protein